MSAQSSFSGGTRSGPGTTRASGPVQYPSPFFDHSSQYMPPSSKELFRWASFLYLTHPEIAPIINKKASYAITKLVYEADQANVASSWKKLLEEYLHLPEFEFEMLIDFEVLGNAFCSIYYPFEREFECKTCGKKSISARDSDWAFEKGKFKVMCPKCKVTRFAEASDRVVQNRRRVRLLRWNPKYMSIDYNAYSGDSVYTYNIPKTDRIKMLDYRKGRNKDTVATTPLAILLAVAAKAQLRINADNIYHMRNTTVSMEDGGFGMSPLLPVFKAAWLYQVYRKAQEGIALDHTFPITLLSPTSSGSGLSPHDSVDLGDWANRMQNIIRKARRDPNGIFTVPFPASVENIRGDAQALSVTNEMTQLLQTISGGLDVPSEFVMGGTLSYSGSSVSLRVLENLFIGRKNKLDRMLQEFIVPRLTAACQMSHINVHHRDFKMADDAQQKQIALGLRQTNTISDRTTIEELGFNYDTEMRRRKSESVERLDDMSRQQLKTAEVQGQVSVIQARYQAQAQKEQLGSAEVGQAPGQQVTGNVDDLDDFGDPRMLDLIVHNFLKTRDPGARAQELKQMSTTNPQRAQAIRARIKLINKQVKDNAPAPEQRPGAAA